MSAKIETPGQEGKRPAKKSEKVMEAIGRQYVKTLLQRLEEIENGQAEIKREIAEIFNKQFSELFAKDVDRARGFLYELMNMVDHFIELDRLYRQVMDHLKQFLSKFEEAR
jgi:hypothetical protein